MADPLDPPANWFGRQPSYRSCWRRVRLVCHQLETRDTTGNIMTGFVAAILGDPAAHPTEVVGRLVGDWAMSGERPITAAEEPREVAAEEPAARWLTPADRWLDPLPGEFATLVSRDGVAQPWWTVADGESGFRHRPLPMPEGEPAVVTVVRADRPATDPAAPTITAPTESAGLRSLPANMTVSWPAEQGTPFAARPTIDQVVLINEIPNKAPTAVADTVTVNEDGTVLFDPTTNDTDPDAGDALWVSLVQDETKNGRVLWEEGGYIRYLPNPDFHGTDTISYTVTDGLAEATGTVSITVNSVNDAPSAFNDGYSVLHWPGSGPDELQHTLSVLGNDFDPDGKEDLYAPVELDKAGMPAEAGKLEIVGSNVIWTASRSFNGAASFRYRARDIPGAKSDWAEVKLWAIGPNYYPPPGANLVANPDVLAIGDDPVSGNVRTNDTGGESIAILVNHPTGARLTSFEFDGSLAVLPSASKEDTSFTYQIVTPSGAYFIGSYAQANVNLTPVDLTIHHGQGGRAVTELREHVVPAGQGGNNPLLPKDAPTGAFTVANLNDSNANNVVDGNSQERNLIADPLFQGSGEVDLMKLTLKKPAAVGDNKVTLKVTPAGAKTVRLWKSSVKADENPFLVADTTANSIDLAVDANFPTELWVETVWPSGAVGDVTIESKWLGVPDIVSITSIWTKYEEASPHWPAGYFMANGETALPAEADDDRLIKVFQQEGGKLGQVNKAPVPMQTNQWRTHNAELAKFLLLPGKLTPYVGIGLFEVDLSRNIERISYFNGDEDGKDSLPGWLDFGNDDYLRDDDEDDDLFFEDGSKSTNFVFQFDAPGLGEWTVKPDGVYRVFDDGKIEDYIWRGNLYDFVRIKIGGQFRMPLS